MSLLIAQQIFVEKSEIKNKSALDLELFYAI